MTWRFCGFPAFASGLFSAQSAGGALSGRPGYLQPIIVDGVGQFRAACVAAFAVYKLRLTAPQNDALIGGVIFGVLSGACARAIDRGLQNLDVTVGDSFLETRLAVFFFFFGWITTLGFGQERA